MYHKSFVLDDILPFYRLNTVLCLSAFGQTESTKACGIG